MPTRKPRKRTIPSGPQRSAEVLDVQMTAGLLTVSPNTVYDLFKSDELPGRKVGRKWLTTRAAVLRWIESFPRRTPLLVPSSGETTRPLQRRSKAVRSVSRSQDSSRPPANPHAALISSSGGLCHDRYHSTRNP